MSCASATHTLACAVATISGRASESRSAVARLIGNMKSDDSCGAGLSLRSTNNGEGPVVNRRPPAEGGDGGIGGGTNEGTCRLIGRLTRSTANGVAGGFKGDGNGRPSCLGTELTAPDAVAGARSCPLCRMNRSITGDTDDGGRVVNFRLLCVATGSRAGTGEGACTGPGKAAGGEFAVTEAAVWAAHGTGASQEGSKAIARIDRQEAHPLMASPPRSIVSSVR